MQNKNTSIFSAIEDIFENTFGYVPSAIPTNPQIERAFSNSNIVTEFTDSAGVAALLACPIVAEQLDFLDNNLNFIL